MMPNRKRDTEPLCKFGPGGDFVAAWEPEPPEHPEMIARLLGTAVDAIAAAFGLKQAGADIYPANNVCPTEQNFRHREKPNDEINISTAKDSTDAATAPAPANDCPFPREPLLFPDLSRNGIRIKHKPKHRIRTSHRVAKKGAAFRIPKQGSLFEGQFTRARIA